MLDFRIETFLQVCEDMNYTRAAQRLNLTQPAVSQHIRWLEEKLEAPLFLYQGKKLQLTPAGILLKNTAATMNHDILNLKEKMQETLNQKPPLKMGLTLTIAEFEVSRSIAAYLGQNDIRSALLSVDNTKTLLQQLDEGYIDFALVEGNFPRDIYHHQLYARERYIGVCRPDDPLASGTHSIEELLQYRLVTREAGSGTRNILERYLEMKSLEVSSFSALVEAGSIGLIKQLVEYGCGITFLYQAAVNKELKEGRLCEITIANMEIVHDFSFIWRENSLFFEDYQKVFEFLKEHKKILEEKL